MNSLTKKISFLIDQRYAEVVKSGRPFNPILQPSLFGFYILSVLSNLFTPSDPVANSGLSWKSRLMHLVGHRFFPDKHRLRELTGQEIFNKQFRFSEEIDPKVTFLVLCGDNLNSLVRLLESIEIASSEIDIELVLIVAEGEEDIARFIKDNTEGRTIYPVTESDNLISSLNFAVANSKGEFFTVLDPSVCLQSNWLRELLREISRDQDIAMVNGQVLNSDGLLEEAGTFVDADCQLQKYGNSDRPDRPKYNFLREIECSAGSNDLVRRADFERAGGFQMGLSLAEAYCGLSFTFRKKLEKKIIYTPHAEVIRQDSGKGEALDVSEFLGEKKQGSPLRSSDDDINARILLQPKSVLFIDIGLPEHDRDSGSLRAFYLLKLLRELGNHVIVVPRKGKVSSPYFEELISLGVEVLYAYPDRKGMMKELTALLPSVAVAWICRPQLNAEFEWIFEVNPRIKWIFDTIDLHYVRLAREAEVFKNQRLMKKSARFKKLELSIASKAHLTITVTEDEKSLLQEQGTKNVAVIPNIHESHQFAEYPGFTEREGLLFIGSYHHPPNVDAVKWLVEEIMPIVWEKIRIPVTLLGNAPGKDVQALESELVSVPGYVKDIAPYFTSHRVFVAPLRYGAGMKGKIGESLAYRLPIVTTSIGSEGVGLTDGVDVLIADDKVAFAQQIFQAYQDELLWRGLACNSDKVLRKYSPEQIRGNLAAILEELG